MNDFKCVEIRTSKTGHMNITISQLDEWKISDFKKLLYFIRVAGWLNDINNIYAGLQTGCNLMIQNAYGYYNVHSKKYENVKKKMIKFLELIEIERARNGR